MRLIDADALRTDFVDRYHKAEDWIAKAEDVFIKTRAEATRDFIGEVIMTIDNAPTVSSSSGLTEAEKIICKMYLEDLDKFHTCNEYKLLMSLIDNAPTVEPERPKGEWTVTKLQHGEDVTCPFCNARPTKSAYGYYLRDKFCHECGADMRKGGAE